MAMMYACPNYQPEYPRLLERYRPLCRIDDCPGQFDAQRAARLQGKAVTDG